MTPARSGLVHYGIVEVKVSEMNFLRAAGNKGLKNWKRAPMTNKADAVSNKLSSINRGINPNQSLDARMTN